MNSHPTADGIDLADVVRALRRGWRVVAAYVAAGLALALAIIVFVPKRYEGTATVVLKTAEPLSALRGLGALGGALGGDAAGAVGGLRAPIETELQILNSRALATTVIDSLKLQARVKKPHGVPAAELVRELRLPGSFKRTRVSFEREADGYHASGSGIDQTIRPGFPAQILGGSVVLRADRQLPESFTIDFMDPEDATNRFIDRLSVGKAGGEVARVRYTADDSITAANVPNAVLAVYLVRRRTTDAGVNQHRVAFLTAKLDSTREELAKAEQALRNHQESSGILNAEVLGRVQVERGSELRKQLIAVQVEEGAIGQLLTQVERGTIDQRQLAAYPTFLKSTSLNDLISQLSTLEAERLKLLERRTEKDPEVIAIDRSIDAIEGQFLPMARSYAMALKQQRTDISSQLDTLRQELGALPAATESAGRLQRDVQRLGQIYGGMQAQLVEARLAAITEGGDVRQLDIATPPKKVAFPRPLPTLAAGATGGLMLGLAAALMLAAFGRWVRDPLEIERATGVPTLRLDRRAPLIVANASRTVLVVPLHPQADSLGVAKQLVETALSRSLSATLLDLGSVVSESRGNGGMDVNGTIDRLSGEFANVVVRLPSLTSDATLAALNQQRPVVFVVPPGRVEREQLMSAMQTLRRLDVPCAGIVVSAGAAAELPATRAGNVLTT